MTGRSDSRQLSHLMECPDCGHRDRVPWEGPYATERGTLLLAPRCPICIDELPHFKLAPHMEIVALTGDRS